ncbi:acylaminoacyl-peptidase [Coprinopsis marcescibilis]|uniref:acylaminoacyl-peptidase n=1 Tax=Coprinopsis marcescibilis TaxID=230819 RepID=A0A5C3KFN7_COPMA|nr:acylaminoacyl-peptidase [Coprinopsis marcescibilis]
MYTELASIPIPDGGQFIGRDSHSLELSFMARDHDLNTTKKLIKTIGNLEAEKPFVSPANQAGYLASLYSPSSKRRVVLKDIKGGEGSETKRVVELWDGATQTSLDVTDKHGVFYTDDYFGSLSFNPSETVIVYTAEANAVKDDPLWKFRQLQEPDFGEGLSGKRRPTAFIVNWPESDEKPSIRILNTPTGLHLGQFVFSRSASQANEGYVLYATGYETQLDGRILGVKGCFNRASGIWKVTTAPQGELESIDSSVLKLTAPEISCRSPRVIERDGKDLVLFLSCVSGGPHVTTSSLLAWSQPGNDAGGEVKQLVAVVQEPEADRFPGLYPPYNLPAVPYLSKSGAIVVSSHVGSRTVVVFLSLDGSRLVWDPQESQQGLYSWSVLATDGRSKVLCWRSSPSVPYEVGLLEVQDLTSVKWRPIDTPLLTQKISKALSSIQTSIHQILKAAPTEVIVVQSSSSKRDDGKPAPCVLVPHGGPHATTTTAFSASTIALALEGYTLALPNYTGSLGYGEAAIHALVTGRCGRRDVDDCIASLDYLVDKGLAEEGPGRVFVMGGSHGGFLSAHLIGQFPDKFSAAVMRNPVISVGEISTTDIPDWYFAEFGFPYPVRSSQLHATGLQPSSILGQDAIPPIMTGPVFSQLQTVSPIHHVNDVKSPVLLFVGLVDRRVAPTHGIEYYHALKARGKEVEVFTFPNDSHPLESVETAKICWEQGRDWFNKRRL